ncbi:MAG: hypothetical protein J6M53_06595 [Bacteroidaceae bacterium]|nr:hypothetical protein [Bacteroidaceae bacterium]
MGLFKKDAWEDYHKHAAKRDIKVQKAMLAERSEQEREAEERRLLREELTEQLDSIKADIANASGITDINEKIVTLNSLFSAIRTIESQAYNNDFNSLQTRVDLMKSNIENAINIIPSPVKQEEQLQTLAILTEQKIAIPTLSKWIKELATKARAQYPENTGLQTYVDKVLGKVIPSDASLSKKVGMMLGNLFRKRY